MKKLLFAAALIAALIPFAAAQDSHRLPQASLDREVDVLVPARPAVLGNPPQKDPSPPSYCKPCLFYAGDFDSNASDANGLANEVDIIVSTGAAVYAPFVVPTGKTWTVTGLFTDNFMSSATLDPATSPYEIRRIPVGGGSGGRLVCSGTKKSTTTATGLGDFGFSIYAVSVKGITKCTLHGGIRYWESVVPYCTNPNDSVCTNSYRSFEANDDGAMNHRFGKPLEPSNDSFFNSVFFGATWTSTTGFQSSERFSDGVIGTSQ